jgi:cysteine desulfurase
VGRGVTLTPVLHGGGQERDVRSGTLDVAAIAGFAVGVQTAVTFQAERAQGLASLRDRLVAGVRAAVPDAILNGPELPEGPGRPGSAGPGPARRLPGNAHFSFPGCDGDALLLLLDARGIECSTGSACSSGVPRASHVLLAMGVAEEAARGSLRFSLGHTSTDADIDVLLEAIGPVAERASRAGQVSLGRAG